MLMKKILILSILFGLYSFSPAESDSTEEVEKHIPAYESGETLEYLMYYGFINGGSATMNVKEIEVKGRKLHHAKMMAKTSGWADNMYKVRDIYESYFDPETGKPILSIRDISEADYRYYNKVTYYHKQQKVKSERSGEHKVPDEIFDIVSAFYYSRSKLFNNVEVGDTIHLVTFFDDQVYPIDVRFRGREEIKTKAGKFKALKFSPVVEVGRIFDTEDDLSIWVSDDKNYLPLRVEFDLMIGSLKCDLVEYSGIKHSVAKLD